MSINDRYKIVDRQLLHTKETTNVYWYQCIEGADSAEDLASGFVDTLLGSIRAIQSNQLTHTSIEVINYDNEADFFELALTTGNAGLLTGEAMPKFVAWGFKLQRPTRAIRSGSKRIAGVAEGSVVNGVADSGIVGDLDNAAAAMADIIILPSGGRYQPQIVSINRLTGEITQDIGFNEASYLRVTSQNSRKR